MRDCTGYEWKRSYGLDGRPGWWRGRLVSEYHQARYVSGGFVPAVSDDLLPLST